MKILSILDEIGLETDVKWVDSNIQDIYSNHISISDTSYGTNGKGTTEEYALASGYAELIERIQSGILKAAIRYNRVENQTGYVFSPDETFRTAQELISQQDSFLRFFFDFFQADSPEKMDSFLKNLPKMEDISPEQFRCLPFADLANGKIVYIPVDLLFPICGSNGMAAGNTPEEALVQALSELLERYANKAVLNGVVPPEIPRDFYQNSGISSLVEEIERGGRYHVSIRDCSLGKGLPVTAVVLSDYERGTFGVHFGCHPSFDVSVERCLTEALQGKSIESAATMNEIGDQRMCDSVDNGPNLMKIGYGAYPINLFSDEPSYPFTPNDTWTGLTNKEMLKKLIDIIQKEGYDILVRDASHLGFPTYHVLIPGMSELFFSNGKRIKELRTVNLVNVCMKRFPDLTLEEENRLLLLLRYKQYSVVENTFGWIVSLPIKGNLYTTERLRAFLHYKHGEYFPAYEWFKRAAELNASAKEKQFLLCSAEYAWLMHICAEPQKAYRAIKNYFNPDIAIKVHEILQDPAQTMKKAFESFHCYDCANCSLNRMDCDYSNNEKALMRIQAAISKSTVNQVNTLEFFHVMLKSTD